MRRRLAAAGGLLAGTLALTGCAGEPEVVTETVEVPVEVEVEVVPVACLSALEEADQVLEAVGELLVWYEETGGNAFRGLDVDQDTDMEDLIAGMESQNAELADIQARAELDGYVQRRDICKSY